MEIVWAILLTFVAVLVFVIWKGVDIVSRANAGDGNRRSTAPRAKGDRIYYLELVGEQNYKDATSRARVGDEVQVLAEQGNPHDAEALVVCDMAGRTLGYIQRGSWLHRAMLFEDKGCEAYIEGLTQQRGFRNIRISVTLTKDEVRTRQFVPAK